MILVKNYKCIDFYLNQCHNVYVNSYKGSSNILILTNERRKALWKKEFFMF